MKRYSKKKRGKRKGMRKPGFGKKVHPLNRTRVSRGGYQN